MAYPQELGFWACPHLGPGELDFWLVGPLQHCLATQSASVAGVVVAVAAAAAAAAAAYLEDQQDRPVGHRGIRSSKGQEHLEEIPVEDTNPGEGSPCRRTDQVLEGPADPEDQDDPNLEEDTAGTCQGFESQERPEVLEVPVDLGGRWDWDHLVPAVEPG